MRQTRRFILKATRILYGTALVAAALGCEATQSSEQAPEPASIAPAQQRLAPEGAWGGSLTLPEAGATTVVAGNALTALVQLESGVYNPAAAGSGPQTGIASGADWWFGNPADPRQLPTITPEPKDPAPPEEPDPRDPAPEDPVVPDPGGEGQQDPIEEPTEPEQPSDPGPVSDAPCEGIEGEAEYRFAICEFGGEGGFGITSGIGCEDALANCLLNFEDSDRWGKYSVICTVNGEVVYLREQVPGICDGLPEGIKMP